VVGSSNEEMSARTRRQLVAAAMKLFSAQGYAQTSVQELVDEAGLTKGAFYHHYKGKEGILREIHDTFLDEQVENARAAVVPGQSASVTLRKLIQSEMRAIHLHQEAITIFLRERRAFSPEAWKTIKAKRDELEKIFFDVIERGIAGGEFRADEEPRLVAYGILGMVHWAHEWYRPNKFGATSAIAETFSNMVLEGLTGRQSG
jgi:AcrR family transcriptional regulator